MVNDQPASNEIMVYILFGKGEGARGVMSQPLRQEVVEAFLAVSLLNSLPLGIGWC
jgi:hypothetical protein